jgi:hypothetical protein
MANEQWTNFKSISFIFFVLGGEKSVWRNESREEKTRATDRPGALPWLHNWKNYNILCFGQLPTHIQSKN